MGTFDHLIPQKGAAPAAAEPPKELSWADVASQAFQNAPASAGRAAGDIAHVVTSPIETAKNLGSLGLGVIQLLIPGEQADEQVAAAVGKFFVDRYGSIDAIKQTLATDPVGAAMDLSMLLTGGGGLAARAPGLAGKLAKIASQAGRAIDPIRGAAQAARLGGKATAAIAGPVVGQMTGAGADALKAAYSSGVAGGEKALAFVENLRSGVPADKVVEMAKTALGNMRAERSAAYQAGMAGIKADAKALDFRPIDAAVAKIEGMGKFKGKDVKASTRGTVDAIKAKVGEWREGYFGVYHTAEGLDALKQAVGDIRGATEFGSASRVAANEVYHAIRNEIARQAPDYAKIMKGYETASDLIVDVERSLSMGNKAAVDTTLRKLQSIMRNNAYTNYGRRADLGAKLAEKGAPTLMESLAGQALNAKLPRGLQGLAATGAILGGAAATGAGLIGTGASALPMLAMQSPRLMGEAAHAAGRATRGAGLLSPAARYAPAAGGAAFQASRLQNKRTK